ncbi:MAG: KH domain-containing protein [Patescibacteria group bacterium]|nr:KH domain-containing protein [Patescibacteria group bacterium]
MDINLVKEVTEEILSAAGLSARVEVSEKEGQIESIIDCGADNALLIGFHGETLNSLQTIVNLIIFRRTGQPSPVTLDVAGYRQERAERIKQMTVNAADRARFLAKPIELSPMPAAERRLVHLFVGELPGVKSESVGEGRDRRVVVRPSEGSQNG